MREIILYLAGEGQLQMLRNSPVGAIQARFGRRQISQVTADRGADRFGYTSFGQLTFDDVDGNSIVDFHGAIQVAVADVTGLTGAVFLFA